MPELPEAETIARGLNACIGGARIERARVHRSELVEPMTASAFRTALRGRRVESVGRRGKWIVAILDGGRRWVTQLRMTGRFTWSENSGVGSEPHLSLSVRLQGPAGDGTLRFYDVRRFARSWVLEKPAWAPIDDRLGIEPLSDAFTVTALADLLAGSRAPLRNVLLDQNRIAGIGNIYANEICHLARLDPRRPAYGLDQAEVRRLRSAIQEVLQEAIERRGTSFSDYRDVLGDQGDFQNVLRVYDRAGERCKHCGDAIERVVLAGRSAYFCPACQT